MKSLIKIFVFAFIAALPLTSCVDDSNENEYCYYEIETAVAEVTGPETAEVNQEIVFTVKFQSGNGCYKRSRFSETGTNTKTISVFSFYEGCVCTQQTELISKEYKFKPTAVGTYSLKFKTGPANFITKTVDVTQ